MIEHLYDFSVCFFFFVAVSCPKLSINLGALTVEPNNCTNGNVSYATVCRFTCKEGYQLVGPGLKTCTQSGTMHPVQNPSCKGLN